MWLYFDVNGPVPKLVRGEAVLGVVLVDHVERLPNEVAHPFRVPRFAN